MEISNWKYDRKDIADYPKGVKDPHESVLANSVNAANYDLLREIKEGHRALEIGCGAASYLRDHFPPGAVWDAIDVYEQDSRGRPCIATRLGSVHAIPFENEYFDWVLSNQSMEHWFEYGVKLEEGLSEICRVLKVGGHARLNFPFHLHGHPAFVRGDLGTILRVVDKTAWKIDSIIAYSDSNESDYPGWRRCGFPDSYVQSEKTVTTSYVVELALSKLSAEKDEMPSDPVNRPLELRPKLSAFRRAIAHGSYVFLWKTARKILKGKTGA